MKNLSTNKLPVAGLVITAVLLLAGCEAAQQPSATPPGSEATGESGFTQETAQYSLADQAAYNAAMELNDQNFCDKITNEDYKNQCKTDLADRKTINDVRTKLDAKICEKLSTKDLQDACAIEVEATIKAKAMQEDERKSLTQAMDLSNEIIESGDYQRCKELNDENFARSCELNILTNKAIQNKDLSWCDNASFKDNIQTCKDAAKVVVQ